MPMGSDSNAARAAPVGHPTRAGLVSEALAGRGNRADVQLGCGTRII
jgi:hypothetical protein